MVRIPGSHAPNIKNRSSKHLIKLTKMRPIAKCMTNEELSKYSDTKECTKEISRRSKKNKDK